MIVAGDLPPSRGNSFSQVVIRLGNGETVEMEVAAWRRKSSREEVERRFTSRTALDQTP